MTAKAESTHTYDVLTVRVFRDAATLGTAAAEDAVRHLAAVLETHDTANVLMATGSSQRSFHQALARQDGIDWRRVVAFHLDEYVGLDASHPASFRHVLRRGVIEPLGVGAFHGIDADRRPLEAVRTAYARALSEARIDLCCLGIGENGHLAFNDPPYADFDDPEVVKPVELDAASRHQQVREGHFANLEEVPTHALTVTIPALLNATRVQCVAPEGRKAHAVARALEGPIDPSLPASILRRTPHAQLYLDHESAGGLESLRPDTRGAPSTPSAPASRRAR